MKLKCKVLIAIAIVGIAGSLYGLKEYNRKKPQTEDLTTQFSLTSTQLVQAFNENETKANATYVDKVIEVAGTVSTIETTDSTTVIYLGNENSMSSVLCNLKDKKTTTQKGEKIVVKGICTGFLMDVVLNDCIIKK